MNRNDSQLGCPERPYVDTKANIEALTGLLEGVFAYATDSNEFGFYDGSAWNWGSLVTNGNTHNHVGGDGNAVSEFGLILGDYTLLDVSTSAHGFAPKLPNDSTKFLNGVGAWAVPAGGGGSDTIRTKYIITPSIASNNLTIAMKYIDGNDCTSTNKLTFRVGDTEYDLTAAMSFTKNAGTNWCNAGSTELAAQPIDFFVYAIGETGASAGLKFGFSRIPYAKKMGDFVNTSTSQWYIAGNWTNFNSTDAVTNIGRFRAQLSATAAFNWSIASAFVVNYPIYNTARLDFNASWTGFSSAPTNSVMHYEVVNDVVTVWTRTLTGGTSNAASMYIVSPFTTPTITNAIWTDVARCTDNGSIQSNPCLLMITSNSNSLIYRKTYSSGADDWTTSGTKFVLTSKISYPLR